MTVLIILAAVFVAFLFYMMNIYNGLIEVKHAVEKALANIDILLKQRHDELPKLVETCKQYMGYEVGALTKVMEARKAVSSAQSSGDIAALGMAEGTLRGGLGGLFAVAEDYPDLKADKSFTHLQSRISELEEAIADRREFYNESVNINNVKIEQLPEVFIASLINVKAKDLLEFADEEKVDHDIKSLFN